MKNIRYALPAFLTSAALLTAVAWYATVPASADTAAAPAAALAGPCEVKGENWRGKNFYEILFMNHVAGGPGGIGN